MHPILYTEPKRGLLELSSEEWVRLIGGSAILTAVAAMIWPTMNAWPLAAVGLTLFVLGHMCFITPRHVAFPDLIVFAACLQWLIGPLLSDAYPPTLPVFNMSVPLDAYFEFAVPATFALWLGLNLPVSRRLAGRWAITTLPPLSVPMQRLLDVAIGVGMVVDTFGADNVPGAFAFLVYLIALIRFFAALSWMVTRTSGWWIRVAVVGVHFVIGQSAGGLFYSVVHWSGYFLLVFAFMRRWRWQLVVAILAGLAGTGLLQQVKPVFRQSLNAGGLTDPSESFVQLLTLMRDRLQGVDIGDTRMAPGDTLIRFNQGWIIAHVMDHVPAREPYAEGRTLADAAVFSLVPRFLFPNKAEGASRALFSKYTGVTLGPGTTMGLGIIGEMYANFGPAGGIVATFVYGLLVGWVFALFAARAAYNPLWWAAAALVLVPSVEPGINVEDIANHAVKAGLLLIVTIRFTPALQELLAPPRPLEYGQATPASAAEQAS